MPRFAPEPEFRHGQPESTAVLLLNLGTPDAPTPAALKRYLAEFLADPRVVEIPRLLWWPLLHGIILNTRPRKSAHKYASIWSSEGSPLLVHSQKQAKLLQGLLGERGLHVKVAVAMRYGNPGIAATLTRLKQEGVTRILLLPLYPQYAASTTASALDAITAWLSRTRRQPEIRSIGHYHDDPGYLDALEQSVRDHWRRNGLPDASTCLLFSFHGLPRFHLERGDPYHCHCHKTARLLAERLHLSAENYRVSFQSRFGRTEWLQPYTTATLQQLAGSGVRRLDVLCPGFPADCLETLEEIALEGKSDFLAAGGREFHYIPALNESPRWIAALADLACQHLQGWPVTAAAATPAAELAASAARARHMGAKN